MAIATDYVDGLHYSNIKIDSDCLDSSGSNYIGNTDGIHLTNCINFNVNNVSGVSGDDLVAITIDGTNNSYNGLISNISGTSTEASIVIIGGETGATGYIRDIRISNIVSNNPKLDAVRVLKNGTGYTLSNVKRVSTDMVSSRNSRYAVWYDGVETSSVSNINSVSST
jgi:hypothetical protein